jgi:hypothetical protein
MKRFATSKDPEQAADARRWEEDELRRMIFVMSSVSARVQLKNVVKIIVSRHTNPRTTEHAIRNLRDRLTRAFRRLVAEGDFVVSEAGDIFPNHE